MPTSFFCRSKSVYFCGVIYQYLLEVLIISGLLVESVQHIRIIGEVLFFVIYDRVRPVSSPQAAVRIDLAQGLAHRDRVGKIFLDGVNIQARQFKPDLLIFKKPAQNLKSRMVHALIRRQVASVFSSGFFRLHADI